jgi:hypothetical protein
VEKTAPHQDAVLPQQPAWHLRSQQRPDDSQALLENSFFSFVPAESSLAEAEVACPSERPAAVRTTIRCRSLRALARRRSPASLSLSVVLPASLTLWTGACRSSACLPPLRRRRSCQQAATVCVPGAPHPLPPPEQSPEKSLCAILSYSRVGACSGCAVLPSWLSSSLPDHA